MRSSCSAPSSPAAGCKGAPAAWGEDSSCVKGKTRSSSPLKAQTSASGASVLSCSLPGSPMHQPHVSSAAMGHTWVAGVPAPGAGEAAALCELQRSDSPVVGRSQHQMHMQEQADCEDSFQPGVRHAGWLWKRFGHGHKTKWKRLWFYLVDDRLCYCQAEEPGGGSSSNSSTFRNFGDPQSTALYAASCSAGLGGSGPIFSSTVFGSTGSSAAALAAGKVKYIPLDRIPVRPLPHKPAEHALDPMQKSHHPDAGVAIVDARVLTGRPLTDPKRTVFSMVSGSHTHYLAADTARDAQLWVSIIRQTWLHCFSHAARSTGTMQTTGVVVSQKLMAQNAQLRESIQELNAKVSQTDYEYWRKWVEEKAKNQVLESKLVNTAQYEVLVKTGSMKGAGTDARMYLELFGHGYAAAGTAAASTASAAAATAGSSNMFAAAAGGSGEVRLFNADSNIKPFQRGALDSFTVLCHDVGLAGRLRIWHDNTGKHPDWFLVDIKVRKKGARDWITFPCNRWLSTERDDNRICLDLTAGCGRPQLAYQVVVHTSDVRGAGTDANVYIQLHGLLGDGIKQQLLGGPASFDRGQRDEFVIDDADLGELTAVTVSHDSSGKSPGWHLDHIEVTPLGPVQQHCLTSSKNTCANPSSSGNSSPTHTPQTMQQSLHSRLLNDAGSMGGGGCGGSSLASTRDAGVTYLFPCAAFLDECLGDGRTERKLLAASTLSSKVWYSIFITTADVRGAGTDAEVYIALTGSEGSSGKSVLPSRPEHFERGCRDKFRLQLPHLGKLMKLLIGHDGRGDASSWKLELVEVVEEESGKVAYFMADRWLGVSSPDGLSEITLTPTSSDPRTAHVEYQLCFLTSPLRGAGTDSTVSFELKGDRGTTGPITAAAGKQAFERGSSDMFSYSRQWLGQLQQLVVWHDNAGAAAGRGAWHLEAVVVSCSRDKQVVTFPCGCWLSSETQLKVQLKPGHAAGLTRYRFDIVTSNIRGAGTDGAVSLELIGQAPNPTPAAAAARAGPWSLDRAGAFARGQTDTFIVEGTEVLNPGSLQVTLQSSCSSPDWHPSHIVCTVLEGEDDTVGIKYYFSAQRWFDSANGMAATLSASSRPPGHPDDGQLPYVVKVFTSDLKGAGTDANISVNVIGLKGSSGWQQLRARQDTFERGQEDVFTVKLPDLGPLTQLGIKSDGAGDGPAWHLDRVCIIPPTVANTYQALAAGGKAMPKGRSISRAASLSLNMAAAVAAAANGGTGNGALLLHAADATDITGAHSGGLNTGSSSAGHGRNGQPVWFVARRWLDAVHGLEVLLEVQATDPAGSVVPYQVEVHTSDIKNAGTDSRVFLQLFGDVGSSYPLELQDPNSPQGTFLRGGADAFSLKLPKLGVLNKLKVWLEGPGRPWHLEMIAVQGPAGDVTYFRCGSWLGMAIAGSQHTPGTAAAPLELFASKQDPRQLLTDYKVITRTSDVNGASTDATVFVELIGANGSKSGEQQLQSHGPYTFDRGCADEFRLRCDNLGELAQLRIGHDGRGKHPGWHLMQVEVTDVPAGRTWYFEADCWLDASQGDGKTERLLRASSTDPLADRRTYKVVTHTSRRPGAGMTDGSSVFITLHGSHGGPVTSTAPSSTNVVASSHSQTPRHRSNSSSSNVERAGLLSSARCELTGAGKGAFDEGGMGSFLLPVMRNLGQLRQMTLEIEAKSLAESCSWHCQHIEVTSSTGECWLFPCNAWLKHPASGSSNSSSGPAAGLKQAAVVAAALASPRTAFAGARSRVVLQPAPDLEALWQQQQLEMEQLRLQQQERYRVAVYTSDISNAGVRTSLIITLCGSVGEAGPFNLARPSGQLCFRPGACDLFDITSPIKLGQLLQLKVEAECSGHPSGWHLDAISISTESTGVTTWFYAGRWFNATAGLTAVLEGAATDIRAQMVDYKVTVHTGDVADAGTDAQVHIEMHGADGSSSGPHHLANPVLSSSNKSNGTGSRPFQRGQADSFTVRCRQLGDLQKLTVWHDHSGAKPSWNLAYIEVLHMGSGQVWYFPCGQWLDSIRGDSSTRKKLTATKTFDPASLLCAYRVTVTTGNIRGAGTDANVYIIISGDQGDTGRKELAKKGRNCFERGQRDDFRVAGADVGVMSHITIGHDGSGLGPAWHLSEAEVEHMGTGQVLHFNATRWLDGKRDAGSLQCELWPNQPAPPAAVGPQVNWELMVITGKAFGSGTDADVFIKLIGSSGSFGPHQLPAGPEAFETGCKDTFSLSTPDIGELRELTISHNNMGTAAAWFLQGLELTNLNTGVKYVFKVAAWLDVANGLSRTLKPSKQQQAVETGGNSSCSYQVEIQTSDVEGAGTDAGVFVQLAGVLGETEALQLQAHGASNNSLIARHMFMQGSLDMFILRGLPDVGAFTQLRIGHDGSGEHPAWYLSWVRIVNLTTGVRALFTANTWLDATIPGCNSWVQLTAGPDGPVAVTVQSPRQQQQHQPGQLGRVFGQEGQEVGSTMKFTKNWLHAGRLGQPGYKVTFYTSNIWGAGTASKVFFELFGEHGSSGVVYARSQHGQFGRGHQDSFLYPRLPYLGELFQLKVGTDGTGMFAAWHVRQVEVVHVHSGQRWLFQCHDWVDKKCTWQKVLSAVAVAAVAGIAS